MSATLSEGCMKPADLERIRIVTRHFADLQGLRWMVPLGIGLLDYGALELAGVRFRLTFWFFGSLAGWLANWAKRFYRRRFGEVERFDTPERWDSALYFPPVSSRRLVRSGVAWERVGRALWPRLAGAHIVEATKSLYAIAAPEKARVRKRVLATITR